jgi:hypothetical protein
MSAPQPLLEDRKALEQLAGRGSLQNFHGIGYSQRRREANQQVDMVGLNFFCHYRPTPFRTNPIKHLPHLFDHRARPHLPPLLGTRDHMVGRLIYSVPICNHSNHICDVYHHGAVRAPAIPPLTEVRGFLASIL